MQDVLFEFHDFGFQYTAQAKPTLYHIDLKIRKGEKILIAGPSGCGKSTLASCINGLIPFAYQGTMTGSATLRGVETKTLSLFDLSKTVGTVLQDTDGQFIGLTVAEDIAFALENDCVEDPDLHAFVRQAAEAVHVESHLGHAPDALSGGQKQRVSLAGVMVNEVELLLFDEPLANLDPATGKKAMELIDEMRERTGAACVIIEHRLEDALHLDVDRIILMQEGRIIADMAPDELLSKDLLEASGIREPLYITALKYAGVSITPDKCPRSMRTLSLTEADRAKVRTWFETTSGKEAPQAKDPIFQARDICFSYANGWKAIKKISMEILDGEMLAIVGKNGAGKSTFSKLICGFETPQSGTMEFAGVTDWAFLSIKERADHVGYCMQNPNQMISKVQIFDEVALGLRTRHVPEEEVTKRVEEVLTVCGLYPFRHWPISALSYGQKKRVTIASILVLRPEIIILDEPTAGQDYRHYTEIMEFLRTLSKSGITIVIITHDMHLMLEYAHRVLVFADGEVVGCDTPAGVLTDQETIERASLKETSLYALSGICGIEDGRGFVQHFIDYERERYRS